ncbi:MAG: DUF998 domain-containing protein [Bellilinea sp.]
MLQKILLSCGIIAPLIYLGTDRLTGKLIKGYSFSAQSMGELGAAGSPARLLFIVLTLVASAFLVAFVVGVWKAAGQAAVLPRIVAGLIFGNVITTLIATLFFPNRFGVQPNFGTPGVFLMFLSVLCFVLAMIVGAVAFHGWMRFLSITIPVSYVLLTILRLATAVSSTSEAVLSTGAQERTMAYSFLAWVTALAIYLLMMSSRAVDSVNSVGG